MKISEVRAQYPQYTDLTDEQLGQALHAKFYSDIPYEEFSAKVGLAKAEPKAPENLAEQRKQVASGATLKFGPLDTGIGLPQGVTEALAGMGRRFTEIGTLGNREKDPTSDRLLDDSGYATAGSVGADLATLVGGGAALRGAASLPQLANVPRVAGAMQKIGQNMLAPTSVRNAATTAATYGAATTNGGIEDRGPAALLQGVAGAAGQALPKLVGSVIRPNVADDVAALQAKGIRMTPGQMGPQWMNRAEQKVMSLPIIGDAVTGARQRTLADFNKAVANEVLDPLGKKATQEPGRALVREVQSALDDAYEQVLPRLRASYTQDVDEAINAGKTLAATAGKEGAFDAILKLNLYGKFQDASGNITGKAFKEIDSGLNTAAREARLRMDSELARAVDGVRMSLRSAVQGSPDDVAKLKAADASYARLVRMETAAAMRGAKDGVFTPAQFANAVERQASRKTKAAGTELMGGFADDAERRLSTNFPNSGTADRMLLGGLALAGGGAAAGALDVDPAYLVLGGLGAAAYTRPGQALMRGAMARPNWLPLQDVASGARALAPAGGLLAPLLPVYAGQK